MGGIFGQIVPKCSFRIGGLSDEDVDKFEKNLLNGLKYKVGRSHKNTSRRVLVIPLDNQDISSALLLEIISKTYGSIDIGTCRHDFIISVYTGEETFMVDIPEKVLDLFKIIGGDICFSYTYRPDDPIVEEGYKQYLASKDSKE